MNQETKHEINNINKDLSNMSLNKHKISRDMIEKINLKFYEICQSECLGCQYDSLSQIDHECVMGYPPREEVEKYKKALQFWADQGELKPEEVVRLDANYRKKIKSIYSCFY